MALRLPEPDNAVVGHCRHPTTPSRDHASAGLLRVAGMSTWWVSLATRLGYTRGRGTSVGPRRKRIDFLAGKAVPVANMLGGPISEW
ncbi:hypothetical protein [Mycobacterium sp.]|uniref:hypothetical protein n=1 Tax=Mycobacterium sp. TaxID=1785 RepID=UPI003BAF7FD3